MQKAMKCLQLDEIENVLASVEMVATVSASVRKRRYCSQWKWVLVGTHDALQGAIVCAIADSTGTSVLSKKSAKEMLAWLEKPTDKYPQEFMADFKTLLEKTGKKLSDREARDIRRLHSFRNEFVHFTPKGWSLEIAGLPRIVCLALTLTSELMQAENVNRQMSGNKKRRLSNAIAAIRREVGPGS